MSNYFLVAPVDTSPFHTQTLSDLASTYLTSQKTWLSSLPYPLSLFVSAGESQETWQIHENLLLACLRTGDNDTAFQCIEALTKRFGLRNDRVMALHGLYQEAIAKDDGELLAVLKMYESLLAEDNTRFSVWKRKAAILKTLGRVGEAAVTLTGLVEVSPTDAEAWAELADIYLAQSLFEQAVYCLEEVLLLAPNAWNMHAKLGEVMYLSSGKMEGEANQLKTLSESMRRFCRSIELCDDYLRGYYGLKLTSTRLLEVLGSSKKSQQATSDPLTGDLAPPSLSSVKKLNELSTAKLAEILRRTASGEAGWDGFAQAELAAARALLDKDMPKIQR